jgi:dCTP deaminase
MTEPRGNKPFSTLERVAGDRQRNPTTGLLPSQMLREAVAQGREILSPQPIGDDQIQPASIDLRLGEVAYRVRASFLPGSRQSVRDKLDLLSMHRIDLTGGAVLEKDCVYIVPLFEYVALRKRTSGFANPRSSIGRLDVFARVITDGGTEFDRIRDGYKGPLYAEVSPRAFSILVRTGSRLVQLRILRGSPTFSDTALRKLHEAVPLIEPASSAPSGAEGTPAGAPRDREVIRNGLAFTVDVSGEKGTGIVGFKARRHTGLIDVDQIHHYDPRDFWEPVYAHRGSGGSGGIVLDPHDFYILASRGAVVVPADHAAKMLPYDTFVGEFRVHFAGFFDPGFGTAESGGTGSRAVLEVRSHEVPFLIEDGQVLGRLVYERLISRPDKLYGRAIGSSYQSQGLALSKHFKKFAPR